MNTLARSGAIAMVSRTDTAGVSRESASSTAQGAAGGAPQARSGSWSLPAPEGVYGALTAWPSAAAWFDAVMDALRSAEGETARRRAKVAPDTLLRVAYADRAAADQATGRGVSTAHETVAARLGMSAKTVQRARRLMEALGLAVTVAEGRYLTTAERREAQLRHGGHQLRAASTRALTMPAGYRPPPSAHVAAGDRQSVENVQLPPRRGVKGSSHLIENSLTRARSRPRKATASRRPAETKMLRAMTPSGPRGIDVQRLAAGLIARMPWLDRGGRHIGRLCALIERHGLAGQGWTARALVEAIDRGRVQLGVGLLDVDAQRDPLRYFAWLLGGTVPAGAPSPSAVLRDESRERARRQAIEAAEERARRAQIEADAAAIDHVIAAMRQQFPRPAGRRR